MAEIAQRAGDQRGERQAGGRILDFAEQTAQTEHTEGDDVVEQHDHDRGKGTSGVGKIICAQQQLKQAEGQRGEQAPAGAVAVGNDEHRQHAACGDGSAVWQIEDFDDAQHRGERQHDGAFGQADRAGHGFALVHGDSSLSQCPGTG